MLQVKVSGDRQVLQVLGDLAARARDLRPALSLIGARMVESTKQRFDTATAPDGTPWAANKESTLDQYLHLFKGSHKKDGTLSKSGASRVASKKPLTGETWALKNQINYQLVDSNTVSIGSPMPYAAMQQFGGGKSQFPHLWGDIPARPFLGFSDADQADILAILREHFKPA